MIKVNQSFHSADQWMGCRRPEDRPRVDAHSRPHKGKAGDPREVPGHWGAAGGDHRAWRETPKNPDCPLPSLNSEWGCGWCGCVDWVNRKHVGEKVKGEQERRGGDCLLGIGKARNHKHGPNTETRLYMRRTNKVGSHQDIATAVWDSGPSIPHRCPCISFRH